MTSSYNPEKCYEFEGWDEEYQLKNDFENFLWDIADAHCSLRCDLKGYQAKSEIQDNVDQYLAKPLWHSRMITDFLLVDYFDAVMLLLEGKFQLGYFPYDVKNKIGYGIFAPFNKQSKRNRKIIEAVAKFVMITDEISKSNYYPARLIERLKQLEDLNLIVPSLIYPLLGLRKNQ